MNLGFNQIGAADAKTVINNALQTNRSRPHNTKELKSTIVHTARAIAKISPAQAPEDQQLLATALSSMPNEVIANITKFMEAPTEPHSLTVEQREKLTLNAVEDGRKYEDA